MIAPAANVDDAVGINVILAHHRLDHLADRRPSKELTVKDYPRQVWLNAAGDEVVESYTIAHMAHGTPVATGQADFECGAAGPFLLEVGISSSFHIAQFFTPNRAVTTLSHDSSVPIAVSGRSALPQSHILNGEILQPEPDHPGQTSTLSD
jgi:feruloyl esterase